MIKNYFKVAWRNLQRHKIFTAINLIGLIVAFTSSILVFLAAYLLMPLSMVSMPIKKTFPGYTLNSRALKALNSPTVCLTRWRLRLKKNFLK